MRNKTESFGFGPRKTLNLGADAIFLPIDNPRQYDHMLKRQDRDPVNKVLEHLGFNHPLYFEFYLTGGVVNSWIEDGKRAYGDVDLVVAPRSRNIGDGRLDAFRGFVSLENNARKENNSIVSIEGRDFSISRSDDQFKTLYVNGPVYGRIGLQAQPTMIQKILRVEPSPIDLIFIDQPGDRIEHFGY